jgi:DNA-binding transcriptional regulator/RsmH inhibitor MraZ
MIGNYINKLDEKGRITIPAKFRNELGGIVVLSYGFDNTLEIRSQKTFKL